MTAAEAMLLLDVVVELNQRVSAVERENAELHRCAMPRHYDDTRWNPLKTRPRSWSWGLRSKR